MIAREMELSIFLVVHVSEPQCTTDRTSKGVNHKLGWQIESLLTPYIVKLAHNRTGYAKSSVYL